MDPTNKNLNNNSENLTTQSVGPLDSDGFRVPHPVVMSVMGNSDRANTMPKAPLSSAPLTETTVTTTRQLPVWSTYPQANTASLNPVVSSAPVVNSCVPNATVVSVAPEVVTSVNTTPLLDIQTQAHA